MLARATVDALVDAGRDVVEEVLVDLLRNAIARRARLVVVQGGNNRFATGLEQPLR